MPGSAVPMLAGGVSLGVTVIVTGWPVCLQCPPRRTHLGEAGQDLLHAHACGRDPAFLRSSTRRSRHLPARRRVGREYVESVTGPDGGQGLVQAGPGAAGAGDALVEVDPVVREARAWRWAVRSCRTVEHLA